MNINEVRKLAGLPLIESNLPKKVNVTFKDSSALEEAINNLNLSFDDGEKLKVDMMNALGSDEYVTLEYDVNAKTFTWVKP